MADEFAFAERMKSEFSGRGLAASGSARTGTGPGTDSRPGPAEEAHRNNPSAPSRGQDASRPGYRSRPPRDTLSEEIAGRGHIRQQSAERQDPALRTAGNRSREAGSTLRGGAEQNRGTKLRVKRTRAAKKRDAASGKQPEEYKLRRTSVPVAAIALTLVAVLIIFTLVESVAEVYQTSTEINRMKGQLEELKETAAALELKLDEKNDVRTIREIAVGELGMAEEDTMQRRFISVSGGERIELLETEEDSVRPGGVLFSSLGEFFNRFLSRFR